MSIPPSPSAGHYAVSTTKIRPWRTPQTAPTKSRRAKAQPVILHPVFEECAELTADTYWKSIFHKAALGKLQRGFMFKDGYLTHKRGTKFTSLEVPSSTVEAVAACIGFFTKSAGLMSPADQERNRLEYDQRMLKTLSIHTCRWDQIKKRVRDILINAYIQDLITSYSLNETQAKEVSTLIHLGFFLGHFQRKSVEYAEGRILSIGGLQRDPDTGVFYIDPALIPKAPKVNKAKAQGGTDHASFMALWLKFLKRFEKKGPSTGSEFQILNAPAPSDTTERTDSLDMSDSWASTPLSDTSN